MVVVRDWFAPSCVNWLDTTPVLLLFLNQTDHNIQCSLNVYFKPERYKILNYDTWPPSPLALPPGLFADELRFLRAFGVLLVTELLTGYFIKLHTQAGWPWCWNLYISFCWIFQWTHIYAIGCGRKFLQLTPQLFLSGHNNNNCSTGVSFRST